MKYKYGTDSVSKLNLNIRIIQGLDKFYFWKLLKLQICNYVPRLLFINGQNISEPGLSQVMHASDKKDKFETFWRGSVFLYYINSCNRPSQTPTKETSLTNINDYLGVRMAVDRVSRKNH